MDTENRHSDLDAAFSSVKAPREEARKNSDNYRVNLPNFEGPLDLLLHLIRKEQIDVHNIPIARICESYLEHLELMRSIDVSVASEFLVMASTLMLIKSMMILPRDEEIEQDDPRAPLVAQLIEYEKFKKAAELFDAKPWLFRDVYARPVTGSADLMPEEALLDSPIAPIDSFEMLLALKIATDRTTRKPIEISTDITSIRDKVMLAGNLLARDPLVDFRQLLPENPRIQEVVIAFLAILELAKLKFIEILQTESCGPIQIRSVRPVADLNVTLLDQY